MYIVEKEDLGLPKWLSVASCTRPNLTTLAGWKWLLLRRDPINWVTLSDTWQQIDKESRIAYDGKPFNLKLGKQTLRFYPEIPFGIQKKNLRKNWLITDPAHFGSNLCGFARLRVGDTVMVGRANKKYKALFDLQKNVGKRHVNIINEHGGKLKAAVGIPEEQLRQAAKSAVCKINIDSDGCLVMTAIIRKVFAEKPAEFDPRKYLGPAREELTRMIIRKNEQVLGSAGRA